MALADAQKRNIAATATALAVLAASTASMNCAG